MPQFSHLHVHTQYSLLDGAAFIPSLMKKASADGMRAMAITDHGNMFGAFNFFLEAKKENIMPIMGCEFYLVEDRYRKEFTKENSDHRYHQLLLAKNQKGYQNLAKLCSLGYIEGMYSKYPRIDKRVLAQHCEGLIATSCCIGAEIPQAIIFHGEEKAEELFKEWHGMFGDDFYVELQRHNLMDIDGTGVSQEDVNQVLLKFARKYNVKVIATNDSHYVDQPDHEIHDIMLCINSGEFKSTPIGHGKGFRFGFPNDQFYFKTQAEMAELFKDIPEALDNTNIIVDSITPPELKKDLLMPNYALPKGFETQGDYLRHLSFEGARKRYGELSAIVVERLEFELATIIKQGFPGYFLIVQDFTTVAREMGVIVGPGRGSAAGSVVAYVLGITNIDPIKYDLLFERFLNPDRNSMPDIDIDFDDEGRNKVIQYVSDKYGKERIAQLVTYGSMGAKSSIKDVGRVLSLPLRDADRLSKLVPNNADLQQILGTDFEKLKATLRPEEFENVKELNKIVNGKGPEAEVLQKAKMLEGSVRNTGVHACGLVIAPDELSNILPVAVSKESPFLLSQFDVNLIEQAGLLKMDFLGLKTLSIIKKAVELIEKNHGVKIDVDSLPLDDPKTFETFQRGETNGVFQFESAGMQKHMKELKPNCLEDLIAMNALYRPGPMEYIPKYIARKHGKEVIKYDLEVMEEILKETYGITVYQEQVMLLSQRIADFTKGEADYLRKAMGKKDMSILSKLKPKFMEQAEKNGHDPKILQKIWTDWEAFASYAFNKSHSTCYAFIAFQTMYLKANYPHEFMSSNLINNMDNMDKVSFFMEECRRMGIVVLGPDVNESSLEFNVNDKQELRFGLAAIKGVGEKAAQEIVDNRVANGPYTSIFDLVKRINLRAVNKKNLEALVKSGAFDFDERYHRAQYLQEFREGETALDSLIKFGNRYQENLNSNQASLFGDSNNDFIKEPDLPNVAKMGLIEELKFEKEYVGFFISRHPLDNHRIEAEVLRTHQVCDLPDLENKPGTLVYLAGIINNPRHLRTKKDKPFGIFSIEDYSGTAEFAIFGNDYLNNQKYLLAELFVLLKIRRSKKEWNDEMEWKIESIQVLDDSLFKKEIRKMEINLMLENLHEGMIDNLSLGFKDYPGKIPVTFNIVDNQENMQVYANSKAGVTICKELIDLLNEYNISYRYERN